MLVPNTIKRPFFFSPFYNLFFIYFVLDIVFIFKCRVNAVQDDITVISGSSLWNHLHIWTPLLEFSFSKKNHTYSLLILILLQWKNYDNKVYQNCGEGSIIVNCRTFPVREAAKKVIFLRNRVFGIVLLLIVETWRIRAYQKPDAHRYH